MSTRLRIHYGAAGEQEHESKRENAEHRTSNVEASFALSVSVIGKSRIQRQEKLAA
jgi:hypothetical protein